MSAQRDGIAPPAARVSAARPCAELEGPSGALLPATFGTRSDRLLPPRPDDRSPEARVGRVLVVQLREATDADAPSPVHGVSGLGPPDWKVMEEDREGLKMAAP